ncbi:hypothetical protein E2P81_ATG11655 [Venturia nashicola]|uniref:Uncharacterized protein n=1 Tax=Venturia nashicola TaxID=86259 RepID=A0A4Z1NDA5_9PEZI|nr:hypothetical protein E6O75_ATG11348 [Venturia nashicola]TLD18745.1 hypothetical protein E2P81_ATG11655 [Venturia nashicola]
MNSTNDQQTAHAPPLPPTIPPALAPPPTSLLRATPSLNGIPIELRDNIFHRLYFDIVLPLPLFIHVYRRKARENLRDNFRGLLLAGGATRREALNVWNSNSVQFIKFRNYEENFMGAESFIWAFARGWRPFGAPTSRRLQDQHLNFDMPHRGLSRRQRIKTTDHSQEQAKERMLDCLRHVQNVHVGLPNLATTDFKTEYEEETYLSDAKWLVDSLNASPMLRKVYIYIARHSIWNRIENVPTPASEERKRRLEVLLGPFQHLNNVEIEVLKEQDWDLSPGTNFGDWTIGEHIKDMRRLAKRVPGQQFIEQYFVPLQTNPPKTSAFPLGGNQTAFIPRQEWTQEELSDDWLYATRRAKRRRIG